MARAAFLATGAALRSGCSLVTRHSTEMAVAAASSRFPSEVFSIDDGAFFPISRSEYGSMVMPETALLRNVRLRHTTVLI